MLQFEQRHRTAVNAVRAAERQGVRALEVRVEGVELADPACAFGHVGQDEVHAVVLGVERDQQRGVGA